MGKVIDITGQKFGRLTVIQQQGKDKYNNALWLCKCDCGNEITVISKKVEELKVVGATVKKQRNNAFQNTIFMKNITIISLDIPRILT